MSKNYVIVLNRVIKKVLSFFQTGKIKGTVLLDALTFLSFKMMNAIAFILLVIAINIHCTKGCQSTPNVFLPGHRTICSHQRCKFVRINNTVPKTQQDIKNEEMAKYQHPLLAILLATCSMMVFKLFNFHTLHYTIRYI